MPPAARRYVWATAGAAALGIVLCGALMGVQAPPAPWQWGAAVLFTVALVLMHRRGFVLHWAGQRTVTTADEPVVALAILVLPLGAAPILLMIAVAIVQALARRHPIKGLYNVSAYPLGAVAATGAFALLAPILPALAAAGIACVTYTFVTILTVSGLFARLEGGRTLAVFRERFGKTAPVHAALGVSLLMGAVALWTLHPVATIALAPLVVLAFSSERVDARANREVAVRSRLAQMSSSLGVTAGEEEVAASVLDACGDLFIAGRTTLELDDGRTWSKEAEGGADVAERPLEAVLHARDGRRIGRLVVHAGRRARRVQERQVDQHLLTVVAGQAASAIERAHATTELVRMMELNEGIVSNVPAAVVYVDAQGRARRMNEAAYNAIPDAVADGKVSLLEWPSVGDEGLRHRVRQLLRREPFFSHEATLPVNHRTFLVSGVPLPGGMGGVLLLSDITDRKVAEEALKSSTLARPFVRRLVLDLVGSAGVTSPTINAMGRRLAAELPASSAEEFADAFRAMGLGGLELQGADDDGTYTFSADDLLERRSRAAQPTCHLALGFLEGAVARVHGSESLGSEVRCQSQGHARCQFVVKARYLRLAPRIQTESPVKKSMK